MKMRDVARLRSRVGKAGGGALAANAAIALMIQLSPTFSYAQGTAPSSAAPSTAVVHVQIAPQALDTALTAFADQAGLKLLFASPDVRGLRTQGFSGDYTAAEALGRLLAGTGLIYRFTNATTVTLQKLPEGAKGAMTLPPVQVEGAAAAESPVGPGQGFVARQSLTGTKTDTPLIETPQAVSVVTQAQMAVQDVQSVPQALRYTVGILPEQNGTNENAYETIYGRGFQLDEYLDGLRLPAASSSAAYNIPAIDPFFLDRIEVLHGPASMLYGQSSPGGLVNLVSKRPTDTPLHEIDFGTGNYGRAYGAFDFGGPIDANGTLSYRLTGLGERTDTQIDHDTNSRLAIAPAFTWRPDGDTTLTVLTEYTNEPDAGLYGFVPAYGTVLPNSNGLKISPRLDIGDPSFDKHEREHHSLGYEFNHRFDDVWSVQQNFRYTHIYDNLRQLTLYGLEPDQRTLDRYPFVNFGDVDQFTVDNRGQAKFATGMLGHTLVMGLDYQHIAMDYRYGGFSTFAPPQDIFTPIYGQSITYPAATDIYHEMLYQNQLGLYAQDQVKLDRLSVILGARGDFYNADDTVEGFGTTSQNRRAPTWRTGLIYNFDNGIAPYFSYATSFQPTTSTSSSGSILAPTTGQQYEAGVKYQPPGTDISVSAALFNLTQQNVPTTDPANPFFSVSTGEVRSRGVELEGRANITQNWNVVGAYTYLDTVNTKSNDYPGKVPSGTPKHVASLWSNYTIPASIVAGVTVGAGVRYVGASYGDSNNTFKVPSVTLFDAMVAYDLEHASASLRGWRVSINASNLFDKTYVSQCAADLYCNFGQQRLVVANLQYRW